jgi:hypothetical protein
MKAPALHADPRYLEAFGKLMKKIEIALGAPKGKPVRIYVAGGAALHLYTGARYSRDVDATIGLPRVALPTDLQVGYEGADGLPKTLYFDMAYNESFALVHENAHDDSVSIRVPGVDPKRLDVRLFSPVDLAVSKLSRLEAHDQEDIMALARAGLIDASSLRQRAEEALPGYVGVVARLRTSLETACRKLRTLERRAAK